MTQYQSFPAQPGDSRTLDKLKALRLPGLGGHRFLDVGCNEGFFCGFARFQGAVRSVGVDHSREFVARARARFPDCEFVCEDWSALPEGPFDVILLASALHYADDQPALVRALVERLSDSGTLVLEVGVAPSSRSEWVRVERGIDERDFPSMKMLREMLSDYAWKWMGPSIPQDGDPIPRHVVHVSRRRPIAYLLMQPPGYGKSSIAANLFPPAGIPVVSGDEIVSTIARGTLETSAALKDAVAKDYSPYSLDQTIQRVFEAGLGDELVRHWLGQHEGSVALDAFIPGEYQASVERLVSGYGYLPVRLQWDRMGSPPVPEEALTEQAEAFYLSLIETPTLEGTTAPRPAHQPVGFIDEVGFAEGYMVVRGWAIDAAGGSPATIEASLNRKPLRVASRERQLRPDVQRHLGLAHALVGYCIWVENPHPASADPTTWLGGLSVRSGEGVRFAWAGSLQEVLKV